jgi:hypothetical protein
VAGLRRFVEFVSVSIQVNDKAFRWSASGALCVHVDKQTDRQKKRSFPHCLFDHVIKHTTASLHISEFKQVT